MWGGGGSFHTLPSLSLCTQCAQGGEENSFVFHSFYPSASSAGKITIIRGNIHSVHAEAQRSRDDDLQNLVTSCQQNTRKEEFSFFWVLRELAATRSRPQRWLSLFPFAAECSRRYRIRVTTRDKRSICFKLILIEILMVAPSLGYIFTLQRSTILFWSIKNKNLRKKS